MARKSVVAREKRRIQLVARLGKKRELLRNIIKSHTASEEEKWEAQIKMQKMPRNSSYVRVTKRCNLTGRPHGVYSKFGLSRNMLRLHAMNGEVSGLVKSSW